VSDVHPAAARGFADGAGTYQRGRPDYPRQLLTWLREALFLEAGKTVVDLGAGTGKFTRLLIETGADILAVEPVDEMRAELTAALPGVRSASGTAQAIPAADESMDAVLCAQSFHWFASLEALADIHRVLRPGGRLGLVWNVRDERVDWVAAIAKILAPYEGDAPRHRTGGWRQAFDGTYFTDLVETQIGYAPEGPIREVVVDRFLSVSFIAALAADERAKITEQLESLMATHPELAGRQTMAMPYQTRAFQCVRK
jgi:SAM-dependent methyltransferase